MQNRFVFRAGILVAIAVLVMGPFIIGPVALRDLQMLFVFAVALIGLNILTGMTGQVSVGHGAFIGIGAYVTVFVTNAGANYVVALLLATAVTGVVGLVCGLPALRMKGMYLAMVTLGLAIVFPQIVIRFSQFTAGSAGLTAERPMPTLLSQSLIASNYWVLLLVALLATWCFRNMRMSRLGRSLVGLKEREVAALTLGVPVARVKVLVYGIGAAIAGLAGWMFVVVNAYVSPADFTILLSINLLLALVIGGQRTVLGPILGAAFLVYTEDWISSVGLSSILTPAVLGVVVILVLLVFPQGLAGLFSRRPLQLSASSERPVRSTQGPNKTSKETSS